MTVPRPFNPASRKHSTPAEHRVQTPRHVLLRVRQDMGVTPVVIETVEAQDSARTFLTFGDLAPDAIVPSKL